MRTRPLFTVLIGVFVMAASSGAVAAPISQGQQSSQQPTATIANLRTAIQGEANAAHRYDLYAEQAQREGYDPVARLFRAAALSERVHLRNHEEVLRALGQEVPAIQLERVQVGTTRENLKVPIEGERTEASEMYPKFIRQAEADGIAPAVRSFTYARETEAVHDELFKQALANLGHNANVDYYVQPETGMVITRSPGRSTPVLGGPEKAPQGGDQPAREQPTQPE
jgi:rubrerythrin